MANLIAWARWRSQKQAQHYAKHPPKWEFYDSIVLLLPKRFTWSPLEDLELTTVRTKELWLADNLKRPTRLVKPRAKRDPVEHRTGKPTARPATVDGDTPSSSGSDESSTNSGTDGET